MNPTAALKRREFRGEIGFCSTKLAPSSRTRCGLVPLRIAKATEFRLLVPCFTPPRTSRPPPQNVTVDNDAIKFFRKRNLMPPPGRLTDFNRERKLLEPRLQNAYQLRGAGKQQRLQAPWPSMVDVLPSRRE